MQSLGGTPLAWRGKVRYYDPQQSVRADHTRQADTSSPPARTGEFTARDHMGEQPGGDHDDILQPVRYQLP